MFNTATLFASLFWGSIGIGFAIFGRKQGAPVFWIGGLALILISYFVWSALWMSLVAIGIIAAMFWLRRRFD